MSENVPQSDNKYPPVWREKEPGDEITGAFVAAKWGPRGEFGTKPLIVTLETADGPMSVFAWTALDKRTRAEKPGVLLGKLLELEPKPGERIRITYLGLREPRDPSGKPYKDWDPVSLDRPEQEFSFASARAELSEGLRPQELPAGDASGGLPITAPSYGDGDGVPF